MYKKQKMIYLIGFILFSGWALIFYDAYTLNKQIHKGDELDLTINDFINQY